MLKNELETVVGFMIEYLKTNEINSQTVITLSKKLKIVSEIQKIIEQSKDIKERLSKMDTSEKIAEIRIISKNVLRDTRVRDYLSTGQIESIEELLEESETLETIVDMIEFIVEETKDPILEKLDDNRDGVVTVDEMANDVNCCGNTKVARCWSRFIINCLCCGKNDVVEYEMSSNQAHDEQQAVEEQAVEEQAVEEQAVEEQAVEEQAVEEQAVEEQAVEEQAVEEQALEEQTVEEQAVEEQAVEEQTVEGEANTSTVTVEIEEKQEVPENLEEITVLPEDETVV